MDILFKIFVPLNYLRIHHPQKRRVDIYLPVIFSSLTCVIFYYLPKPIILLGETGLISSLTGFLQMLSGFYITALAAIATFPNKNIDEPTDGVPLSLDGHVLTRRQFLSYMFGFLAFTSFILVLVCKIILGAESNIIYLLSSIPKECILWIRLFILFVYLLAFNSILFTTLFGLYYLTEKIHEQKAKFTSGIGEAKKPKDHST